MGARMFFVGLSGMHAISDEVFLFFILNFKVFKVVLGRVYGISGETILLFFFGMEFWSDFLLFLFSFFGLLF